MPGRRIKLSRVGEKKAERSWMVGGATGAGAVAGRCDGLGISDILAKEKLKKEVGFFPPLDSAFFCRCR